MPMPHDNRSRWAAAVARVAAEPIGPGTNRASPLAKTRVGDKLQVCGMHDVSDESTSIQQL